MRAALRHAATQRGVLLDGVRRQCGGVMPKYHINFARGFALWDGSLIPVAAIPSMTGTLNLGPEGHTIASLSNALTIPVTLPYPHSGVLAYRRGADSGVAENISYVAAGATQHHTRIVINASDQARFEVTTAGVTEAGIAASAASLTSAVLVRSVYRAGANDAQAARSQNGNNVTFGTADTGVTAPNAPDTWFLGVGNDGVTSNFRGTIHSASLVSGAFTDGNIAAACAAFR